MADEQYLFHCYDPPLVWGYCSTKDEKLQLIGAIHESPAHPVGKSFVSNIEAEKTLLTSSFRFQI